MTERDAAATWHGQAGAVLLGPTEARVARWLEHRTRHGRVTIRTADLAAALQLARSEAYRITARLRVLGLFGIENDRGGTKGGRRYWRTATTRDGRELDPIRHRLAWRRIVGWARGRRARIARSLATIRATTHTAPPAPVPPAGAVASAVDHPPGSAADDFGAAMRRHGLGAWFDASRPRRRR